MTVVWFKDKNGNDCGFVLEHLLFTYQTDKGMALLHFRDEMYRVFDVDVSVIKYAILEATKAAHGLLANSDDEPIDYDISPSEKPMVYGNIVDYVPPSVEYENKVYYIPTTLQNLTSAYEVESYAETMTRENYVARFIEERCFVSNHPADITSAQELYEAYCAMPNNLAMSKQTFGYLLTSYGGEGRFVKRKIRGNMHYVGIRLKE